MLNNIYNIDREIDYATVKAIVLKSLETIAKEEVLKKRLSLPDDVIFDYGRIDHNPNNISQAVPSTPSCLKLKITNITKCLKWRIAV